MSQILFLGQGQYITIDRSFADAGKPGRYGMVGNQMVFLSDGVRPHPEILQAGSDFFYKNGKPVNNLDDIDYLPEPYKSQAVAFVNKAQDGKAKEIVVHETKAEAAQPKRGRGRPKKAQSAGPRKIEIKDEESLLEAAGGSLAEQTG